MIAILGAKRVLGLVFLIAINVALSATAYLFVLPQTQAKQVELRGLSSRISGVRTDINRMQVEFSQIEQQQAQFENLKKRGFFSDQQRRQAEKVFEIIQKQAGVISAVAKIEAGTVESNVEAQKAEYEILSSPVKIRVEAIDSVDIFRYLYLLEHFFPGHVAIKNIEIARKAEVTGPILRSIASGENPVLVCADIDIIWRTMIPHAEVIPAQQSGGG